MLKRITFTADEALIARARQRAAREQRPSCAFREWLAKYVAADADEYEDLMRRLDYVRSGGKFTREEMHQREEHGSQ